jgi:hypothetical protein
MKRIDNKSLLLAFHFMNRNLDPNTHIDEAKWKKRFRNKSLEKLANIRATGGMVV